MRRLQVPGAWKLRLLLLCDDQILNLRVGGGWNDFLAGEVSLLFVRAAIDDFLCILVADARKRFQLIERGGVDIQDEPWQTKRRRRELQRQTTLKANAFS